MRSKRIIFWSAGLTVVILVGVAFRYRHLLFDMEGMPFCHKQVMMAFLTSMHASGTNAASDPQSFPNVNGVGRDSLATMGEAMEGNFDWAKDYRYIQDFVKTIRATWCSCILTAQRGG